MAGEYDSFEQDSSYGIQKTITDIANEKQAEKQEKKERELQKIREKQEEQRILREKELEKKREALSKKRRNMIPAFVMLLAGAIADIIMLYKGYELRKLLTILLIVLIIFYIIGVLIKWMFDKFAADNKKRKLDEGSVVEKLPNNNAEGVSERES